MISLVYFLLLATPIVSLAMLPLHLIEKALWMFAHGRSVIVEIFWFCLYAFFWTLGFSLMMLVTAAFISKYGTDFMPHSLVAPWLANLFNSIYTLVSFPYRWVCSLFHLDVTTVYFVYFDEVRPLQVNLAKAEELTLVRDLGIALFGWVWVVTSNFYHRFLDRDIRRLQAQTELEEKSLLDQRARLAEEKAQERRKALARERAARRGGEHAVQWKEIKQRGISIGRTYD